VPGSPELRDLLQGPVLQVAPRLLGSVLRRGEVACRVTEVEAYDGAGDPGSHAFRGPTPRNAVMFGPPGHLYVYFTYGMHFCMNLVCGPDGHASAVLLRAGEVVSGLAAAAERRAGARELDLARGPARLTRALAIDRQQDGMDVTVARSPLRVCAGVRVPDDSVRWGPRVGVSAAGDLPWRAWVDGEPTVSPYRPHVPKRRHRT
jgi:DNA-3-methyladenine glycosylase